MGCSQSTAEEPPTIPVYAPHMSVLATSHGVVAPHFTSLCVKEGSALRIEDTETHQHMFDMTFKTLSSRRTLRIPEGRALVSSKAVSGGFHVYEGDEQNAVSLEIRVAGFGWLVIFANFYDRVSGRLCRILLDRNPDDQCASVFYLKYGQPDLLPKPRHRDVADSSRFMAAGRIRRPDMGDFVEAAPGVDLALLLLMWRAGKRSAHD